MNSSKMDMNKIGISYCICVHNEADELELLLEQLILNLGDDDEIVIQGDQGKVTDEVISIVQRAMKCPIVKYIEFPLKKNFAEFKNNAIMNCSGEYIFLIDPDELPHPRLLANLKYLLFENREVDMFRLPRINIVQGINNDYVQEQRWNLVEIEIPKLDYDSKDILKIYGIEEKNDKLQIKVINPFDYQCRIFKQGIKYKTDVKVHEQLEGFEVWTDLPFKKELFDELDFDWSLFHVKQFERQVKQNNFYSTF